MAQTSEKNILKALAIGIGAVMLMQPVSYEAATLIEKETDKEEILSDASEKSKVGMARKSLESARSELKNVHESAKGLDELSNPSIEVLLNTAERKLTGCESYLNIIDADKKGVLTDIAKENAGREALACENTLKACTESLNLLKDDLCEARRQTEAFAFMKEASGLDAGKVSDESLKGYLSTDWDGELAKMDAYLSADKETVKRCEKAAGNVRDLKEEIVKI